MDPITAILRIIEAVTKLATTIIESQPADVQAELWRLHLEDVKAWREFWGKLKLGDK
ncbi:MAG TPA: hypothetical protein VM531_11280 [Sphingomicrobium sp.]|jgi:hypothetical protein|nr:hypothetical protein [Sphingomicrobium sp.]